MGIYNFPDISCSCTLICDEDIAFETVSALICPSGGAKEPGCKREPNKGTSFHIARAVE